MVSFCATIFEWGSILCHVGSYNHWNSKTLRQAWSEMRRRQAEVIWLNSSQLMCTWEMFYLFFSVDGVVNLVYHCVKYISKMIFYPSCKVWLALPHHRIKEREGSTHPLTLNIISRQFVLHNLTPSVKKRVAGGEERHGESGLLCSWHHFYTEK